MSDEWTALEDELSSLRPREPSWDLQKRIAEELKVSSSTPFNRPNWKAWMVASAAVLIVGSMIGMNLILNTLPHSANEAVMTLGSYRRIARESPEALIQVLDRQSRALRRDRESLSYSTAWRNGVLNSILDER